MLIPKEILDGINEMVSFELTAVKQYMILGTKVTDLGYPNLGKKFLSDVMSEQGHALKEIEYIIKMGGSFELLPEKPLKTDIKSVEEAVQTALDMEKNYFEFQKALVSKTKELKDTLSENFLIWFLDNQVNEINEYTELLNLVKKLGEDRLFMLENIVKEEK